MKIRVPKSMLQFRCNEKGCCCKGWGICFSAGDLTRLVRAYSHAEVGEMLKGARLWKTDDDHLTHFQLKQGRKEVACRFLTSANMCLLQIEKGTEFQPLLCRAFPAAGFVVGDETELHFSAVCPEVLNLIESEDGPFEITLLEAEKGDSLAQRARYQREHPTIEMGNQKITAEQLQVIRRVILEALHRRTRTAVETLASIHYALARLVVDEEPVEAFHIRDDEPVESFNEYLDTCVSLHVPIVLATSFQQYRRFVFDLDLDSVDWNALTNHLIHRPDWRAHLDPTDPKLQTLLFRYLSHRYFAPFSTSPDTPEINFSYGNITHCLATAFRFAVSLGSWLEKDELRTLLKVSLGASEHFYRIIQNMPLSAMPWFLPTETGQQRC